MARFLVEILINAAGGLQARAAFDDVGTGAVSASKKLESLVASGLQAERALRRTAESADRLQHQMEETKASKGLTADLVSLNKRLHEQIAATREGAIGLERYEQKQRESALAARILQTQVKAGVSAQSLAGKEIAEQIRLHDRLQVELRQTAQAQLAASGAGAGGGTARLSGVISSARSMIGTVAAVSATVVGLGYSVKKLTDVAAESEGVLAQLRAGVESTGGAAGHSVASLDDMASAISRLTGVDDELIASGEAILLTFTKVAGDVFPRATASALDMSVRMKSDLNTTILQVGKALNDPIKGVTALTRAGVQFSVSQKEMIKSLVESGDLLGAQTIILKELETQFGGSAAAARDTLGGALQAAKTESGNLVEILAGELSPIIRELTEEYVAWAQSAEGQKQIADLGALVADSLRAIVSAADLLTPALKLIALEAKVLLTVVNVFLDTVGFVVDRVGLARDAYLGWARDAGILRSTIAESTPVIEVSLSTQLDAVFALREEYGKLGEAAIAAARDQMAAMEAESAAALTQAQKNRELLRTREETRKKNAQIGAQRDTGPNAADRELLRQTIELEKHGANLNNIITRQTLRLNEHAVAAKKSAEETGGLSDKTQSAIESAREAIAALALEATQRESAAAAIRDSIEAHDADTLATKQNNEVAKIRAKLLEVGLNLSEKQEASIRSSVKRIEEATKAEQSWLDIRKKLVEFVPPLPLKPSKGVDTSSLDLAIRADKIYASINEKEQDRLISGAAINKLLKDGRITQEQANTLLREYADTWKQIPQEITIAEGLMINLVEITKAMAETVGVLLADSVVEAAFEGKEAWDDFGDNLENILKRVIADWLQQWFRAMAQWRWVATQAAAKAASAALGSGGGGGAGAGMYGSAFSMGSQYMAGAGAAGGSASVSSIAGAFGWVLPAAIGLYAIYKGFIDKSDEQWGQVNLKTGARKGESGKVKNQVQARVNELIAEIREIADILDLDLQELGNVSLGKRGKSYYVQIGDSIQEGFSSVEEALDYVRVQAIKWGELGSQISENVRTAINNSLARTMEDFEKDINLAKRIDSLKLGDIGSQLLANFSAYQDEIKAARALGLSIEELTREREKENASIRNRFLGINTAVADFLEDLYSYQQGAEAVGNKLRSSVERILGTTIAEAEALVKQYGNMIGKYSRITGNRREGEPDQWVDEFGNVIDEATAQLLTRVSRFKAALEKYYEQLAALPEKLTEDQLKFSVFSQLFGFIESNAKLSAKYEKERAQLAKLQVDAQFKMIKLWLEALGMFEEFAALYNDAYKAALDAAGKRPSAGGRGGGGGQDSVRDFIKDKRFELSLAGMSDYARARAELERQYDDLLKQAGKDKKLREELMALKEKEIQLLEKEKALTTVANFESFLGLVTPFDQVRKTAEDLIAQIRESPFGNERKARMIGRVMAEVDRQLDQLAKESALGLFGEMLGDLEKFGALESLQMEVRRNTEIIEHQLKMAHYRAEIEILRAAGRLSPEVMKTLDKALEFLEGIDPTAGLGGGGYDKDAARIQRGWDAQEAARKAAEDAAKEFEDALKSARSTLDKWNESDKPPIRRELEELASELQKVVAVFGATEEVLSAHAKAYQSILRNHLGPIIEYLTGFDLSADSSLSGAERFAEAQSQFRNLITEIAGGNLARLGEVTQLADLYRSLGQGHTAGEGFRFIEKEIKDALGSVVSLVPGIAGTSFIGAGGVLGGGLTGGPSGSSSSPYTIQSPDLQRAIEIGNTMLLAESRNQSQLLNWIGKNTERTANLLTSPLDVRMIS